MKNYKKLIGERVEAKNAALTAISSELVKIETEIEKESLNISAALESGDREAYTASRVQLDYLKQRKEILQKQRADKAAEHVLSVDEYREIEKALRDKTRPIRRDMYDQLMKDWKALQDHFNGAYAKLQEYEATCRDYAQHTGESIRPMSMTGGRGEFDNWIKKCGSGMEFYQLLQIYKAFNK